MKLEWESGVRYHRSLWSRVKTLKCILRATGRQPTPPGSNLKDSLSHCYSQFSSIQFCRSVLSDSLPHHGLQHTRPLCLSPTPRVYSNSCPLSWWCHQPSHLLSPSLPTFNLSQNQSLFKWVSSSHQVAKVLEFQLQHQSFQRRFKTDFLQDGLVGSPCCPRDSQESLNTTVQKHQFLRAQLSL